MKQIRAILETFLSANYNDIKSSENRRTTQKGNVPCYWINVGRVCLSCWFHMVKEKKANLEIFLQIFLQMDFLCFFF